MAGSVTQEDAHVGADLQAAPFPLNTGTLKRCPYNNRKAGALKRRPYKRPHSPQCRRPPRRAALQENVRHQKAGGLKTGPYKGARQERLMASRRRVPAWRMMVCNSRRII